MPRSTSWICWRRYIGYRLTIARPASPRASSAASLKKALATRCTPWRMWKSWRSRARLIPKRRGKKTASKKQSSQNWCSRTRPLPASWKRTQHSSTSTWCTLKGRPSRTWTGLGWAIRSLNRVTWCGPAIKGRTSSTIWWTTPINRPSTTRNSWTISIITGSKPWEAPSKRME